MSNKEFERTAFPTSFSRAQGSAVEADYHSGMILRTLDTAMSNALVFNEVAVGNTLAEEHAMLDAATTYVAKTDTHTIEVVHVSPSQSQTDVAPPSFISIYENHGLVQKGTVNIWASSNGALDVSVFIDNRTAQQFNSAVFHKNRDAVVDKLEALMNTVKISAPAFNK